MAKKMKSSAMPNKHLYITTNVKNGATPLFLSSATSVNDIIQNILKHVNRLFMEHN